MPLTRGALDRVSVASQSRGRARGFGGLYSGLFGGRAHRPLPDGWPEAPRAEAAQQARRALRQRELERVRCNVAHVRLLCLRRFFSLLLVRPLLLLLILLLLLRSLLRLLDLLALLRRSPVASFLDHSILSSLPSTILLSTSDFADSASNLSTNLTKANPRDLRE